MVSTQIDHKLLAGVEFDYGHHKQSYSLEVPRQSDRQFATQGKLTGREETDGVRCRENSKAVWIMCFLRTFAYPAPGVFGGNRI